MGKFIVRYSWLLKVGSVTVFATAFSLLDGTIMLPEWLINFILVFSGAVLAQLVESLKRFVVQLELIKFVQVIRRETFEGGNNGNGNGNQI